jgi:hypothetical protein
MSGYKQKLKELKDLLVSAGDLSTIHKLFFDSMDTHREFLDLGKPAKSELLEEALKIIGRNIFRKDCTIMDFRLLKLKRDRFIHGVGIMNGCITTILYFDDIDVGLAAINTDFASGRITFARLSCIVRKDNTSIPSLAPGNKTVQ